MDDLRKLAEKLAAGRVTFAKPRVPPKDQIDRSYEILSRYPTVTSLCFVVVAGLLIMLICWIAILARSAL